MKLRYDGRYFAMKRISSVEEHALVTLQGVDGVVPWIFIASEISAAPSKAHRVVVMPLLQSLGSVCFRHSPSLELRCAWAAQLSATLARVHRKRFLHRDISPGNILVTDDLTTTYLSDFGCASSPEQRALMAEDTYFSFRGTRMYASDQALSESSSPSEEDDWHALLYSVYWTNRSFRLWTSNCIHRRVGVHTAARDDPAARIVLQVMGKYGDKENNNNQDSLGANK